MSSVSLVSNLLELTVSIDYWQCWVVTRYKSNALLFGVTSQVTHYYLPEVTLQVTSYFLQ